MTPITPKTMIFRFILPPFEVVRVEMLSLFMTYVRLKINTPAKVRKSREMRSSIGDVL